jgi:hypothetical protein
MNTSKLFTAWKQGNEDHGNTLKDELIANRLLPYAAKHAARHGLETDQRLFAGELRQYLESYNPGSFADIEGFTEDVLNQFEKNLLPKHLYQQCFHAWQKGDNKALKAYWGLAYHDVFLSSARKALFKSKKIDDSEIALRVFNRLSQYRDRTNIKDYGHFVSKIVYLSKLEAMRDTGPVADSWEDLLVSGARIETLKLPKKVSPRAGKDISAQETLKRVRKCIQKRPVPGHLVGEPWKLDCWPNFGELVAEGSKDAAEYADFFLTTLMRERDSRLWEFLSNLLFARLEQGDGHTLWTHYCGMLAEDTRAQAELGNWVRREIEKKFRAKFSEKDKLEEFITFALETQRRLEEEDSVQPSQYSNLPAFFTALFSVVCFVVVRDKGDLLHRAILAELTPFIDSNFDQETITVVHTVLSGLKRHDPKLFIVFVMKHYSGHTLPQIMKVMDKSKQQALTLIQKAEEWVARNV